MEEKVEEEGGWRGQGKVRRSFFNEFSLNLIEFNLIFIDFAWFWEAGEAGEIGGESGGAFSMIFF